MKYSVIVLFILSMIGLGSARIVSTEPWTVGGPIWEITISPFDPVFNILYITGPLIITLYLSYASRSNTRTYVSALLLAWFSYPFSLAIGILFNTNPFKNTLEVIKLIPPSTFFLLIPLLFPIAHLLHVKKSSNVKLQHVGFIYTGMFILWLLTLLGSI